MNVLPADGRMIPKWRYGWGCLLLFPVAAWLVLFATGSLLVVADPVRSSDAIVLLSGGGNERVGEALNLYGQGKGDILILTDTGDVYPGSNIAAVRVLREELLKRGVDEDDILITRGMSTSTYDEARHVLTAMINNELESALVITDPYHVFRTRLLFREVFRGSGIRVLVQPAGDHWYKPATWFFSTRGWRATISEYSKLVALLFGVRGG